ncbi:MAG: hypothetical protein ABI165_08255 [Bryobacteraceae bacterium]
MKILLSGSLIAVAVCAVVLYAADAWKTEDSSKWTSEDIQKILTDSPWAKRVNVSGGTSGERRGGRMGAGGLGLPGGGMGRGGGGMGMPGGGMGMPNGGWGGGSGGGMGSGRGGRGGGGRPQASLVTIRWDSAAPVKAALLRQRPDDAAKTPEAPVKDYVITVDGLPNVTRPADSDSNADDSGGRRKRDPEAVREELMESTKLIVRGKRAIGPEDVKIDPARGNREIHFLFPRETPITAGDKEVTFTTQLGRMKVEKKFNVKDMMFRGKLAL